MYLTELRLSQQLELVKLAGDAAKEKCGVRGMMASDIIEGLKEVEKS